MPRRFFLPPLFALFVAAPAIAQVTPDRVLYRDRAQDGKVVTVDGEAKETAAGVQVFATSPDKKLKVSIAAPDMVRIDYGTVPGVERTGQQAANTMESAVTPDAAKIVAEFQKLAGFVGATTNPKSKRYLEFRQLVWSAKLADAKTGDDFKTEAKKIAERLAIFSKANLGSWESWTTARLTARYLCELDDPTGAADAMAILGRNAALTPELRFEAKLLEAGYLVRAGKRTDTEALLKELAADKAFPATGPHRERLSIFDEVLKAPAPPPEPKAGDPPATPEEFDARAAKVKDAALKVETLIAKAKDPAARAAGYAALGEVFLRHGILREAMWAYLWVDVVYNQDRDEQIKAVHRLIQIFGYLKEKDTDKDRAESYRDRLPKLR